MRTSAIGAERTDRHETEKFRFGSKWGEPIEY